MCGGGGASDIDTVTPVAVLKSLNEFYDDARAADPPILTPNEPEFRAYNILTHLRDPDIIWSTELLPPDVFNAPVFQTALTLHALAQRSNLQRGERASLNAFSRFFKFLADPAVPYLFGCILSTHFGEIRKNAIEALRKSYVPQHSSFPARTLAKVLGCDDEEEVIAICDALGVETGVDHGKLVVKLHKNIVIKSKSFALRFFVLNRSKPTKAACSGRRHQGEGLAPTCRGQARGDAVLGHHRRRPLHYGGC